MGSQVVDLVVNVITKGTQNLQAVNMGLKKLDHSTSRAGVQQAALAQRSQLLANAQQRLGRRVLEGSITTDKAASVFMRYEKSLPTVQMGKMNRVAHAVTSSIKDIAVGAGAMGAALYTAKKAFDFANEGAQLKQLEQSFDLMNERVFKTPDLLAKMRTSVRGTISDTKLMAGLLTLTAGTSEELGKSFADAAPKLLEIAKASNKLNPQLGDTAFLYDSIAKGIKRASPLILDNLGIVVKVEAANQKYADALGKTVAALTAEEKQQALLNAVLESGDRLIQQVGGNVDSAADSYAALQIESQNLTNELKMLAADGLTPVIEEINNLFKSMRTQDQLLVEVGLRVKEGSLSQEDVDAAMEKTGAFGEGYTRQLEYLIAASEKEHQVRVARTRALRAYGQAMEGAAEAQRGETDAVWRGKSIYEEATVVIYDNTLGLRAQGKAMAGAADEFNRGTEAVDAYEAAQRRMSEATAAGAARVSDLIKNGITLFNEELDDLGPKMVTWGGRTTDQNRLLSQMQDEVDGLNRKIADAQAAPELFGGMEEAGKVIKNATDRINELAPAIARLNGITGNAAFVNQELSVNYDKVNDALLNNVMAIGSNADELERLDIRAIDAKQRILDLAVATGELTQAQADAIIRQVELEIAIAAVSEEMIKGELTAEQATEALRAYADGEYETAQQAINAAKEAENLAEKLDDVNGYYEAEVDVNVNQSQLDEALNKLRQLGGLILGGMAAQAGMSSDQQAQAASGVGEAYSGTTPVSSGTPPKNVFEDADFYVSGSQPMMAAFSPGDYVRAQKTPITDGGTTIIVDARGASPGVGMEVERAVEAALLRHGIKANSRARRL